MSSAEVFAHLEHNPEWKVAEDSMVLGPIRAGSKWLLP
jgi:hypothetical protein